MPIEIIKTQILKKELSTMAKKQFGDFVKAVVDIKRGVIAVGGELHADEEAVLLDQGSAQTDLWGINLYPHKDSSEWIEFDSMINIRPARGNRSRNIEDPAVRAAIINIVSRLVTT